MFALLLVPVAVAADAGGAWTAVTAAGLAAMAVAAVALGLTAAGRLTVAQLTVWQGGAFAALFVWVAGVSAERLPAASPRAHDRFEGDARLAQLVYDAAEVLRRLLFDLTGEVEPDVDEVLGWPRDWKERMLGHERRLVYDRDDFKRILERKKLSPFGVHVFVEGPSDQELDRRTDRLHLAWSSALTQRSSS